MILKNGNIVLRNFQITDKVRIAQLCNNKKIWDNVRDFLPFPYTEDDAEEFIEICCEENPQLTFVIEFENKLSGVIGLIQQSDVYRLTAEVGYWIGESYWGKGIATKALNLISNYGFNELKLVRIYSGVFDFNKASQRVMEKAGYSHEGVFRKSVFKNNNILDEYRYAKLNPDESFSTK